MLTWEIMYNSLKNHPRNVQTHPIGKGEPLWFYAYSEGSALFIENARDIQLSCSIKNRRKLEHDKFNRILDIYLRREKGDKVSQEASKATQNASYWFGVLYALEHKE